MSTAIAMPIAETQTTNSAALVAEDEPAEPGIIGNFLRGIASLRQAALRLPIAESTTIDFRLVARKLGEITVTVERLEQWASTVSALEELLEQRDLALYRWATLDMMTRGAQGSDDFRTVFLQARDAFVAALQTGIYYRKLTSSERMTLCEFPVPIYVGDEHSD